MINIRTLERIARENDWSVDIEKRVLSADEIDYHMGYRVYDIRGINSHKFHYLSEENGIDPESIFTQDTYPGVLLTVIY